jgi:hypothetical protein
MRSFLRLSFGLLSGCCLLLLFASTTQAQCGVNTVGYGDVGIVTGNPFHAEGVVTRAGTTALMSTILPQPRTVARDSEGRIRTERVGGEYKRHTGTQAGSNVEEHWITICDPVAQTLTQIDTLNATAKIIHSRLSAPNSAAFRKRTYCSTRLLSDRNTHVQVEDLGNQIIEGVEAHGVRITIPMLGTPIGDASLGGESITERWCSDDLSALILTNSKDSKGGLKSTVAMWNIERTERDPELFQIPQGYAVSESVAEPHGRHTPNIPTRDTQ